MDLTSEFDIAEEQINELKHKSIEITQTKWNKKKNSGITAKGIENTCAEVPRRKESNKWVNMFLLFLKEITTKYLPK